MAGAVAGVPSGGARPARRSPARRGQGAALRADILASASAMLARSGDASTLTLRAVAREVGVAATSIYLHFDSVEALLEEVKECRYHELAVALRGARDTAGPEAIDKIRAQSHAYVRFGAERPGEYTVMFTARLVLPGGVSVHSHYADDIMDLLAADLRAVRLRGRPPMAEPEARLVCYHLWTSLHGVVSLRMLRPNMDWPDPVVEVDDLVDRLVGPYER